MSNLKLSKPNSTRLAALQKKFESKGLRKKDWNDILNHALEGVTDSTIEKMVDQHVPDDAVIRHAMKDPEAKARLAEFLRKESKRSAKPDEKKEVKAEVKKTPADPKTEVKAEVKTEAKAEPKKVSQSTETPKTASAKAS